MDGQYFICLLYRHVLCLASAGKVDPIYTIVACISIDDIRIEEVDNGRGKTGQPPLTTNITENKDKAEEVNAMAILTAHQEYNATLRHFLGSWYLSAIISCAS